MTYDRLAPFYDHLTGHHDHTAWTASLEGLARDAGAEGARLLDVACGTGKSLAPMVERGWKGVGCDISPAMVEVADTRLAGRADVRVADMRDLPVVGEFDVVTCLCDAANHLLDRAELEATFAGFERNLASGGVVVFDVNTLATFRLAYSSVLVFPGNDQVVVLEGNGPRDLAPDSATSVEFITYARADDGITWTRSQTRSHHRHHSEPVIRAALAAVGLECVSVRGQDLRGRFEESLDELRDSKAVYIVRREPRPKERR